MEFKTRQSERKDTLNLVDYVVLSKSGQPLVRGMARTLNVSDKGILLETHLPFEKGQELQLTIGLKNNLFEYKGKIAHTEEQENDVFAYGIEFIEMSDEGLTVLREFLTTFNEKHR
ncbi:MAG: PilZ domain-containing protein [Thermodesulfobacteriota bacterium]